MSNNKGTKEGGVGFLGLLQLAFIVLKLVGVIEWSWLWVLTPIWLPMLIIIMVVIVTIKSWRK